MLLLGGLFLSCVSKKKEPIAAIAAPKKTEAVSGVTGNFSAPSALKLDSAALYKFFSRYPSAAPYKNEMLTFYRGRRFSYAWYDHHGEIEQAGNLYNRIQHLPQEGVSGQVPFLAALDSLSGTADLEGDAAHTEKELLLTASYFYFAHKVYGGLSDKDLKQVDWFIPKKKVSYSDWLNSFLSGTAATEPVYPQYGRLKAALQTYRDIEAKYPWPVLKAEQKAYRAGDSSKVIFQIKERLHILGDMPEAAADGLYDSATARGIRHFQRRFGITPDGVIGPEVLRELNVAPHQRVEQICVNMERCRWIPDSAKGEYLVVNIPQFALTAFNGDSVLWRMRVVVGTAVHKTVIFSGLLKYVVFSPYWYVPPGILRSEVLPGIRRNANYLATHHMERYNNGVRQKPGPWNSLGRVKFLFPNSYNIYLHDTPAKDLFGNTKRAFSHGCIRVDDPPKLAAYLLQEIPDWNTQTIQTAMNSGKEKYVTIKRTVPVFIVYFTSWVDPQGGIEFRPDVYNRDQRLLSMISEK